MLSSKTILKNTITSMTSASTKMKSQHCHHALRSQKSATLTGKLISPQNPLEKFLQKLLNQFIKRHRVDSPRTCYQSDSLIPLSSVSISWKSSKWPKGTLYRTMEEKKAQFRNMTLKVLHRLKLWHLVRLQIQMMWQKSEESLCVRNSGKMKRAKQKTTCYGLWQRCRTVNL